MQQNKYSIGHIIKKKRGGGTFKEAESQYLIILNFEISRVDSKSMRDWLSELYNILLRETSSDAMNRFRMTFSTSLEIPIERFSGIHLDCPVSADEQCVARLKPNLSVRRGGGGRQKTRK